MLFSIVGLALGLGLGLDLMFGWLVVMHTYLYLGRVRCHCTGDPLLTYWAG